MDIINGIYHSMLQYTTSAEYVEAAKRVVEQLPALKDVDSSLPWVT